MEHEPGQRICVGRSQELERLRAAIRSARHGRGGVVMVSGPAGIGKTGLVDAATAGVAGVVRGRCLADRGAPPLWPISQIIAGIPRGRFPDGVLDPDTRTFDTVVSESAAARFRLLALLTDGFFAAAESGGGLIMVVEDLQDADAATLALLRHLAGQIADSRMLIVGTHRVDGLRSSDLVATLADMARSTTVQTLSLPALKPADIQDYLAFCGADTRLADQLHQRTAGLPLLVVTVVRLILQNAGAPDPQAGVPDLPPADLAVLIAGLLSGVDPPTRDSAAAAAVLGEDLDPVLLAEVLHLPTSTALDQLDTLTSVGLLTRTGTAPPAYTFAHGLIREGIAAAAPDPATWHRRAATALQNRLGTDPAQAARIAAHWARAGSDLQAMHATARWDRAAAEHALRTHAPSDAVALLEHALLVLDQTAPTADERTELIIALATAHYLAGHASTALGQLHQAASIAASIHRPDLLTAAALVVKESGDPGTLLSAATLCDQALAGIDSTATDSAQPLDNADGIARARLFARKTYLEVAADAAGETAWAAAAEAMALAESCGDRTALIDAVRARVSTLDQPQQVAERNRLGALMIRTAHTAGYTMAAVTGHVWRIDAAYQLIDPAAVEEEITRLGDLANSSVLPPAHWFHLRAAATRAALTGHFDQARTHSEAAGILAGRMGDPIAHAVTDMFTDLLALIRGDPAETSVELPPASGPVERLPMFRAARTLRLCLQGQQDQAQPGYRHLRSLLREPLPGARGLGVLLYLTELVSIFDDAEAAGWAESRWLPWADTGGLPGSGTYFSGGAPARALGRMAAITGRLDAAETAYRAADSINTKLDAQPWLTHTWLGLADVLRRRGTPNTLIEALTLAGQAADHARRLGQPGLISTADQLITQLTTLRRTADPMTPRERDVAQLVARALSNRQIAEQLVLSERTVESHVHNILVKLGLTNRSELIAHLLTTHQ